MKFIRFCLTEKEYYRFSLFLFLFGRCVQEVFIAQSDCLCSLRLIISLTEWCVNIHDLFHLYTKVIVDRLLSGATET